MCEKSSGVLETRVSPATALAGSHQKISRAGGSIPTPALVSQVLPWIKSLKSAHTV